MLCRPLLKAACTWPLLCCHTANMRRYLIHNCLAIKCKIRRSIDRRVSVLELYQRSERQSTELLKQTIEFCHQRIEVWLTMPASLQGRWKTSQRSIKLQTFPDSCTLIRTLCSRLRSLWRLGSSVVACHSCCDSEPNCWWCNRNFDTLSIHWRFFPLGNRQNMAKSKEVRRHRKSKNGKIS